jgi:transcription initiation factor TFIID subunit TAF12
MVILMMKPIDELTMYLKDAIDHLEQEHNWQCECNDKDLKKQNVKCILCQYKDAVIKHSGKNYW